MSLTIRRNFAAIAVAVVTTLGVVLSGAPPAQAASACPNGYLCLYHWVDWEGGRWQVDPDHYMTCWNLSSSYYTTGYVVNDTSGSLIMNADNIYHYNVIFYDWINCNSQGPSLTIPTNEVRLIRNLNDLGWYHKFTSFQVVHP